MGNIAVIDTETNWNDEVMSIGIVLADSHQLEPVDFRYYILNPEYKKGGMYSDRLILRQEKMSICCTREEAMRSALEWLENQNVHAVFAYNARFDCKHLPELSHLRWFDIMRIAAYRQYNPYIPGECPCCKTGRMKQNYGVESIMRMITGNFGYFETHNALLDADDELQIMKLLSLTPEKYAAAAL